MQLRSTTLGELCAAGGGGIQTGPFGSQLHASDYVADGTPSVMPQNLGENVITTQAIARVSAQDVLRLGKYRLQSGDIVYSRRGDVERRSLVRPENDGWLCGTGCLRVRLGSTSENDPSFISYLLGTDDVRAWIVRHAVGATMANLNTSILAAVPIQVPPSLTQRAIAEVLGALDDKIAANAKQVAVADQLRGTYFEAMLTHSASHPLSGVAQFINGRAFTKDASGGGRVVIRIAELNSGLGASTVYSDLEVSDQHLARPGDLLFAWSGSLTLHRWYRPEAIVNQHIFKVIPKGNYPIWVVDGLLQRRLQDFKEIAADKATTMGHIQRRHLDEPVAVPDQAAMDVHSARMAALWDTALAAEQESLALAQLRDMLLPHLMSGRLQVRDAERIVGERV